jgi:hypothetical protein
MRKCQQCIDDKVPAEISSCRSYGVDNLLRVHIERQVEVEINVRKENHVRDHVQHADVPNVDINGWESELEGSQDPVVDQDKLCMQKTRQSAPKRNDPLYHT